LRLFKRLLASVFAALLLTRNTTLSAAQKHALRALPPPLVWVEGTKGWMTKDIMQRILTTLRRTLRSAGHTGEIIILLDSAPQHVHVDVLAHAARLQLHVVYVPARTTWLLQPLDTHVFGAFKNRVHAAQLAHREREATGRLPRDAWIEILSGAVNEMLVGRTWEHAFSDNGLLTTAPPKREAVSNACGPVFPVACRPPDEETLRALVARNVDGLAVRALSRARRLLGAGALAADEALPSAV
jgi:hypothetical protein